jgi:DeoR/GlpR family transcriptional regulator of sugar metabolism
MAMSTIKDLKTHPAAYVRVSALAKYWDVDPSTIYRDIDKGALAVERHGPSGRIRVPTDEARRYGAPHASQVPQVTE